MSIKNYFHNFILSWLKNNRFQIITIDSLGIKALRLLICNTRIFVGYLIHYPLKIMEEKKFIKFINEDMQKTKSSFG